MPHNPHSDPPKKMRLILICQPKICFSCGQLGRIIPARNFLALSPNSPHMEREKIWFLSLPQQFEPLQSRNWRFLVLPPWSSRNISLLCPAATLHTFKAFFCALRHFQIKQFSFLCFIYKSWANFFPISSPLLLLHCLFLASCSRILLVLWQYQSWDIGNINIHLQGEFSF